MSYAAEIDAPCFSSASRLFVVGSGALVARHRAAEGGERATDAALIEHDEVALREDRAVRIGELLRTGDDAADDGLSPPPPGPPMSSIVGMPSVPLRGLPLMRAR